MQQTEATNIGFIGEWLVDAWSHIEESKLQYIRNNQHANSSHIDEADPDEEYHDNETDDNDEAKKDIRLPTTFVHSPAWSAANVSDCLALRRSLGPVTLFMTLTCNPKWPEITSQLRPGQSGNDRPDLIVRVFQQYLSHCMQDVKRLFGTVKYIIRVTEFQMRGLPHAHIAICLANDPRTPELISKFISCELPKEEGPVKESIKFHMQHQHGSRDRYYRCGWPEKCQYGYPKPVVTESYFDERGMSLLPVNRCFC